MAANSKSLFPEPINKDELYASHEYSAQLYVVADQTVMPGFYPWSFAIHDENTETWTTYEVRKSPTDKYPVKHVHNTVPGIPGLAFRFFELASIPYTWLPEVYKVCESACVPGVGGKRCSHVYVEYIVDCLKKAGIVGETQVNYLFCRLERIYENDYARWDT
jgi:hypothetical protein